MVDEVAGVACSETRPDTPQNRQPLPTDSMVTVRLSDPKTLDQEESRTPTKLTHSSVRKSIRFSHPPVIEDSACKSEDDEAIMTEDYEEQYELAHNETPTAASFGISDRASFVSIPSTIRSRSDSSGTLSSNGSAQVDWDELDKSEEQAPRDQGSDEV